MYTHTLLLHFSSLFFFCSTYSLCSCIMEWSSSRSRSQSQSAAPCSFSDCLYFTFACLHKWSPIHSRFMSHVICIRHQMHISPHSPISLCLTRSPISVSLAISSTRCSLVLSPPPCCTSIWYVDVCRTSRICVSLVPGFG